MNNIFFQSGFITETRSAASRERTQARKERAETAKRKKGALQGSGKSMDAWRQGQAAGKSLGQAKTSRSAATSVEKHSITYPGEDPKERSRVTAAAVNALRNRAAKKERLGIEQIKIGKRSAHNKRAVNRTLKRDETMKNLGKLTIKGNK